MTNSFENLKNLLKCAVHIVSIVETQNHRLFLSVFTNIFRFHLRRIKHILVLISEPFPFSPQNWKSYAFVQHACSVLVLQNRRNFSSGHHEIKIYTVTWQSFHPNILTEINVFFHLEQKINQISNFCLSNAIQQLMNISNTIKMR